MRSTVASAIDQSISKIYAKMSETKSLLATILVREGVLLVHNRDFLVLEQRDRDFRHIGGVVLGEGFVQPNELPLDPPLGHESSYPGAALGVRTLIYVVCTYRKSSNYSAQKNQF